MIGKFARLLPASGAALAFVLIMNWAAAASAASISYGNSPLIPPGVSFLGVTESSGTDAVPLYGPPSYFITGMSFTPSASFSAVATNGSGDLTDGQLNFSIATTGGLGIPNVNLSEGGVYSLAGIGSAATQAIVGANLTVTVTQINGVNVAPIVLPSAVASSTFNLAANPGLAQSWSQSASVNVAAALGAATQRATRVDVVIDNALVAVSEANSHATITKTHFGIDIDTNVPEPTTAALAALALCGLGVSGWRKQR